MATMLTIGLLTRWRLSSKITDRRTKSSSTLSRWEFMSGEFSSHSSWQIKLTFRSSPHLSFYISANLLHIHPIFCARLLVCTYYIPLPTSKNFYLKKVICGTSDAGCYNFALSKIWKSSINFSVQFSGFCEILYSLTIFPGNKAHSLRTLLQRDS